MSFKAVCEVMAEIELVVSFIALSQIFCYPANKFFSDQAARKTRPASLKNNLLRARGLQQRYIMPALFPRRVRLP